jgi:tetrahydromethanopterin S-methyltransferase subunit G
LNCKEENLRKIKKRLDGVYKKLNELFAEQGSDSEGD